MNEELARARIRELQQEGQRAARATQLAAARRRRRKQQVAQRRWRALLAPAR